MGREQLADIKVIIPFPSQNVIPNKKQWDNWTLPSKYSLIGVVLGIVAIVLSIYFFIASGPKEPEVKTEIEFMDLIKAFMPKIDQDISWDIGTDDHLPIAWTDADNYHSERKGEVIITVNKKPLYEEFSDGQLQPGKWTVIYGRDGSMHSPDGVLILEASNEKHQIPIHTMIDHVKPLSLVQVKDLEGTMQFSLHKIKLSEYKTFYILFTWSGARSWHAEVYILPWNHEQGDYFMKIYKEYVDNPYGEKMDLPYFLSENTPTKVRRRFIDNQRSN